MFFSWEALLYVLVLGSLNQLSALSCLLLPYLLLLVRAASSADVFVLAAASEHASERASAGFFTARRAKKKEGIQLGATRACFTWVRFDIDCPSFLLLLARNLPSQSERAMDGGRRDEVSFLPGPGPESAVIVYIFLRVYHFSLVYVLPRIHISPD